MDNSTEAWAMRGIEKDLSTIFAGIHGFLQAGKKQKPVTYCGKNIV
jgi:hypothetical protein